MRSRRGFTLIELLLTVVVISVGLVGIMALFQNAAKGAMQVDLNVVATNLAREKLEQVVSDKVRLGYATFGSVPYPDEAFSGEFSAYARSTAVREVASADLSTTEVGSGYRRVDVTVSWGQGASKRVTVSTVLSSY